MIPVLLLGAVVVFYSIYVTGRMFEATPKGNFYRFCTQYNRHTKMTYRDLAEILSNYERASAIEIHDVDFSEETRTVSILVSYTPVWFPCAIIKTMKFEVIE